jgi:NUMOD4 motif/HNH endonuclease
MDVKIMLQKTNVASILNDSIVFNTIVDGNDCRIDNMLNDSIIEKTVVNNIKTFIIKCKSISDELFKKNLDFTRGTDYRVITIESAYEEWRDIKGYEGLYKVSSHGRVKSLLNNTGAKILSISIDKNGYVIQQLHKNGKSKSYAVHRLVVDAFFNSDVTRKYTNHKDGNKSNNHISNLERCTPRENTIHAIKTGLMKPFKLSTSAVFGINYDLRAGLTQSVIAKKYGTTQATISYIKTGKIWSGVTKIAAM